MRSFVVGVWLVILGCHVTAAFQVSSLSSSSSMIRTKTNQWMSGNSDVEEYKNVATKILSNFFTSEEEEKEDPLKDIDWKAPKYKLSDTTNLEILAQILDYELYQSEWFVTGKVNPIYFSDDFEFEDPDVQLSGIEEYARGVSKLFDAETARAEIISTKVSSENENVITVTWRLSGKVNIGPNKLNIKPYICYTDFEVNADNGLIVSQTDRFDIPQWDILMSALFPFTIGKVTAPPAPPVPPRSPTLPTIATENKKSPWDTLLSFLPK